MAHHSKFLSVNLNQSYGKSSSSSNASGYGNGRPRSAGGGGGMVVLSRPRSSSGAAGHKPASRLAVPPPVNLPSLRKEHEHLDPALSKASSGHGGSGMGIGNSSATSWTKRTPPMPDFSDKNGGSRSPATVEQRSFSSRYQPEGFPEKTVILRGEDFPSLMATSTYTSKQKQKQVGESSDGFAEKSELSFAVDVNQKLRSSLPTKKNAQGSSEGGSNRGLNSPEQSRQRGGNFPDPLPLVRLRHTSDWDDDERDRNHADHYNGHVFPEGEAHSSLSRDSGRGDPCGKEFMGFKKEDRNFSYWSHRNSALCTGNGKESSHDRLFYGGRGNAGVTEGSNDRDEVSNNWQRGKPYTNSMISKGHMSPSINGVSTNEIAQNFTKERLMSNGGRSYAEDTSWGGKDTFSSEAMLDLKAKSLRKKKEAVKHTDIFDPARESFEAELERVQRLQEQERQRVMEEQARVMEVAHREAEERERIAREEEERRRSLEEEARDSAWRAEQEKLEAARRAEELRIAREEEKKKILMEEERRKEAARQKLLDLEARIAMRQTEANANGRMKEIYSSRDSDFAKCEKTETMVDHISTSPSFDSSSMNRLSVQHGKTENNWSNTNNSNMKFHDQDGFCSNRNFHRKQFQGIHGPKPFTPSVKRGMFGDQFNGRSNMDSSMFGGWDHCHFDGSQSDSYSERSFQNSEVDDLATFNRVRHTIRQPRVPPPPSMSSSICKNPHGAVSIDPNPNSSLSVHGDGRINQTGREEESDGQILYGCSYNQGIMEPGVEPRMPELMEEPAFSLLQTEEKNSPRYDSQSSLSISNPPSSPTQLSHDEFDDCGGSPDITTSAEEENMTFSEGKSMIPELDAGKIDTEIIPFPRFVEDDDWAMVGHEKMQEEEDHDEGSDSNQEDNEAHESDAWELQMKNKFEDLNVVVEKPMEIGHAAHVIENHAQLGDSGHYLFNKDSEYHEKKSTNAGHVSDSTEEHFFADNSALQSEETIPDNILNASSEFVEETIKEQEDMIFGMETTADYPTDGFRASKISGQNPIAAVSRFPLHSTSSNCSNSSSVPTSSQNDVPAKLQFGLFSGPPLIPSPIPTIQIGSFQMPLPLNTQIDSYTHMQPPHPPLFQFGQIVYTPPTSQSVLPMAAETALNTHHPPLAHHLINGNPGSSLKNQVSQDSTTTKGLDKGHSSVSADKQPVCAPGIFNLSQSKLDSEQPTALLDLPRDAVLISKRRITFAVSDEKKDFDNLISHSSNPGAISKKNFRSMVYSNRTRGRPHVDSFSSAGKSLTGLKAPGTMSRFRGNRLTYNVRNAGSLSSFIRKETAYVNSNLPQRRVRRYIQGTEYRVKESGARQMQCTESFNSGDYYGKPNYGNNLVGVPLRNAAKKGAVMNKSTKVMNEETALSGSKVMGADLNVTRGIKKETLQTIMSPSSNFHGSKGNLNKNGLLEDDIDTPLLSGIVRVFNQPGIEASSDGDGFVEVRSKRKISNERRGQRERETNLKHKATRVPHRHRASFSTNGIAHKSDMATTLTGKAAAKSDFYDSSIAHRRPSSDLEVAKLTTTSMTCQTRAAIGSPDVNSADYDSKISSLKSSHAGSDLAIANDGANVEPSLSFGNNIIALDKASVPLGTWGTVQLNQKAAATSTQSRLNETSNSVQCNPVAVSKVSPDDNKHAISIITKEKPSFSSENLPNFPFDGDKIQIQFGALSSPPPLPPSQAAPSGIWPPGSVILNSSIIHELPVNDHNRVSSFFDKEKCPNESCAHLDDTEAEAEAAASAVAVAVITNDETTPPTISGIGTKGISCRGVLGQSANEEPLMVALPADLSIDTALSLYPPLPTIQSSPPILSHIAGPQPSPFPFFDTNPMLGGPIFAFRPQDESAGPQQSPTFVPAPAGTWPQRHSGVESSFYGSPAGFPGAFVSSPAGVHGHPPMLFYNHFAPVGQFGQVGLSYMGGAYLPTGKQPDWKHSSDGAATVNVSKAASIQHLSTGSGLMQVNSPFTLFNIRPFQSPTDIPVPAQWPPIPHPQLSPPALEPPPLQNSPSDPPYSAAVDLPDELGLVKSLSSNSVVGAQTIQSLRNHSTDNSKNEFGRRNSFQGKYGGNNKSYKNMGSSHKMKQIYVAKSVLTNSGNSG